MRKLYFLKTMLLLCALVVGSGSVWADTTYKLTQVTSVSAGNKYVFEQGGYVMNNSVSSSALQCTNSYNTTGLTGTESYVWTLETATNGYYMKNVSLSSSQYLNNSSKTNVSFGSKSSIWAFNFQTDNTVLIQNTSNSNRFLGFTNSTDHAYKAYATSNLEDYSHAIKVYILEEENGKQDAGLSYDPESVTLELDEAFTAPTFSNPNELAVSYSSDNAAVATVNATTGAINFVGGLGTAVITATSDESSTYKAGLATFTINVVRKTPTLTVADGFGMKTGESVTIDDDIYLTDADGTVNVTSGSPSVVSVEEGKLNALTTGSAVITVNVAQGETYAATSETFTITVTANPAVAPEGEGVGSGYTLVTDASTLADGDKILFVGVSSGVYDAMSTNQKSNNRGEATVTVSSNSIASISDDVQVITLEGSTGAWYFNVGNAYLYAAGSGSNNYLRTETSADNNAKATISINSSTGAATITFQGTNTNKYLRYNTQGLFSCYGTSSSQTSVYIYRQNVATSYDITMGEAGWRTLVSALDVTLPEGLTAYTAKVSGDKAVLTQVTEIAKNQPYLLSGAAGTYTLTKASSDVTAPTDNDLAISDATTGNGVFVLAKRNNVVGFYKWNGGYIGAGRVYLPASAGAREFIGFDDETAGVESSQFTVHSSQLIYDLQGRRVSSQCTVNNSQLKKGLYIVNGKKVIVK